MSSSFLTKNGNVDQMIQKNQQGYEKICIICEKSFIGKANNTKTCSKECTKEKDKLRRKKDIEEKEQNAPTRKCRYCNGDYKRYRERNGFCSRSCASKFYVENGTYDKCKKNILPSKENTKKRMDTLIDRYGTISMRKICRVFSRDSKPQKEIYNFLSSSLGDDIFYNFAIKVTDDNKLYYADMYVSSSNTVIEFNGDYWHCNPNKYDANYYHQDKKMLAEEIWKNDKQKENNIIDAGYNMFVVWEDEYKKDKDKMLLKILDYSKND